MIAIATLSASGGAGKTSTALSLAQVLSSNGRNVALFECDPANLLSHQLGHPEWSDKGLFHVIEGQRLLGEVLHTVSEQLKFVPFGEAPFAETDQQASQVLAEPEKLTDCINAAELPSDTVCIFDTARLPNAWASAIMQITDLNLLMMTPDAQSLLSIDRLMDSMLAGRGASYFLLNRFASTRVLHLDIWTMAKIKLSHRLLPFYLNEDQALPEAFASGQSLAEYSPTSHLTDGFQKLANWIELEID